MINSFRSRLVLLFASLAGGALLVSLLAVTFATSSQSERTVNRELEVSERVFIELMESRGAQLLQAAEVLADDFGFREAVASLDQETIVSALVNSGERIGTDLMVLQTPRGEEIAATHELQSLPSLTVLTGNERRSMFTVSENVIYQLVTVPVMTPDLSAWATLGFAIDDALTEQLRALTGADITFVNVSAGTVLASSWSEQLQQQFGNYIRNGKSAHEDWLVNEQNFVFHWIELQQDNLLFSSAERVQLLFSTDYTEATAEFGLLRQQYVGIGLATLLMALVFAGVTARRFNKPLQELTQAAERLRRGDYKKPIEITGNDEFSHLATTFDAMRDAIGEREKHIVYQVEHDLLTGLPNRTSLQKQLRTVSETHQPSTLLLLNIARFRELNDRLGQRIGDQLLKLVSQRLRNLVSDGWWLARLAGDEFVFLGERGSNDALNAKLMELEDELAHPFTIERSRYQIGFRIGILQLPENGDDFDTIVRRAQMCSQQAKLTKATVVQYEDGMDEEYMRRLRIIQALPEVVSSQGLQLHYQPKIAVADGRVIGVEALIRWRHEELGVIRPDEFIPLAEQTGEIHRITQWVIQGAMEQLQLWHELGHDFVMAINLSAVDLQEPELAPFIHKQITKRRLKAESITLEVTESALMVDPEQAIQRLTQLRALGIKISIDDYGTGYSSLAQLKRLPVDELKLDRSFIQDLTENESDRTIVRSTLLLAREMNLSTVAEGVEDEAAWHTLQELQCDTLQGFFFSRPLAPSQFEKWLEEYQA